MFDYITEELPRVVEAELPITSKKAVTGHSMGGHGALVCFLKKPGM
jgi:S-formylglutathione hydrolase